MKITKRELKQMINESVKDALNEGDISASTEQIGNSNRQVVYSVLSALEILINETAGMSLELEQILSEMRSGRKPDRKFINNFSENVSKLRDLNGRYKRWKRDTDRIYHNFPQAFVTHPTQNNTSIQNSQNNALSQQPQNNNR